MIIKSSNPRTTKGMQLTGNVLSGDTYGVKEHIKANWDGKWNATSKTWTVNPTKVVDTITRKVWGVDRILEIVTSDTVTAQAEPMSNKWTVNTRYGRELAEDF